MKSAASLYQSKTPRVNLNANVLLYVYIMSIYIYICNEKSSKLYEEYISQIVRQYEMIEAKQSLQREILPDLSADEAKVKPEP